LVIDDLFDLSGKVALITGGSRGLGLDMATGLAEAGAALFLAARREQWLSPAIHGLRERGLTCDGKLCDVTDEDQVDSMVQAALTAFGHIDILVNDAGISWGATPETMPLDKWRAVLDVNVTGTFLVAQRVGRHMIERKAGTIINVSSVAGLRGSRPDVLSATGYHASKGAVIALTKDLACQWARYGITVNAIAPGFFPTRMTQGVLRDHEQQIVEHVPLGRIGQADDLKGVAVFLASRAAAFITGHVIVVDGGATAW
jgi:gluconate 5-dehydrogenase